MKRVKYLVIGAGVSGLTFAYQKRDEDVIVLEKDSHAGGLCKSFYQNGFVFDVAGHFFHFHKEETKSRFLSLMKNRPVREVTKCAKVYYNGKLMDAPFQYNIHQLPTDEFLECLTGLYYSQECKDTDSFKKHVECKYGSGIADKFLIPYNEKLYACDIDELEKDSMGVFLPKLDFGALMCKFCGSHLENYNDTFFYPVNGCEEIINALLEGISGEKVHLNEQVEKIEINDHRVYTNGDVYEYDYLINTMPVMSLACAAELCQSISELNYNKVLVLNLGFDRMCVDSNIHWIYFPGDEIFYRVGFYNNIAGTDRLSLYVEIGYQAGAVIDVDSAFEKTMDDLRRTGVIMDHNLIAKDSIVVNPAYAHITSQGKKIVGSILDETMRNSIYSIGRYARWEYSAMDDSMEQALELADRI